MKKPLHILFTAVFTAACLVPGAGMLAFGPSPAAGNETPAAAPRLVGLDGSLNREVLSDAAEWFAQSFGFRRELITVDSGLKAGLFGTSSQSQVALGRDGWLYYAETLDDFTGADVLTERQAYCIARALKLAQDYAESQGAAAVFTIAPNKASLYPQYLPPALQQAAAPVEYAAPAAAAMERQGVSYVDLFTALKGTDEVLYFTLDSHWTNRGAALARDELLAALGLPGENAFEKPGQYQPTHRGDLHEMLYPASGQLDMEFQFDTPLDFTYTRPIRDVDDLRIETASGSDSGGLVMFRDSFGNALHSLMAESFSQAVFSRAMPYNMSLISETGADYVAAEIVERNLPLWAQAPFLMPAPPASPPAAEAPCAAPLVLEEEPAGSLPGYVKVSGAVAAPCDGDSPVYLQLASGEAFEAVPTAPGDGTAAFTAWLPEGLDTTGMRAVFSQEGRFLWAGAE